MEMTTYQAAELTQPAPAGAVGNPIVDGLSAWAEAANAAYRVAETLVQSSFVPEQFRGRPMDATAAILSGAEVGLQPMASLKSFDVIQGTAAPRAMTLRAIVQAAGHEIIMTESTTTRCRMKGRRRGETTWQQVDWTIDRAKQLGVTGKANWTKMPQAMLVARATSELCRLIASDAILGIGYSSEEIADGVDATLEVTVEPAAKPARKQVARKRVARQAKPDPTPAPTPEPEVVDPEPEPVVSDDEITKAQLTALNAGLTSHLKSNDRTAKLDFLTNWFQRDITTSKDLTKTEASQVIDWLNQPADGQLM